MLPRAFALAALILGATFAGCLGGEDAPTDVAPQGDDDADDGVLDVNDSTQAPDGRGDISAFKETNRTEMGSGGMEHKHDYWQGRDRVNIAYIDSGLIPFPLMPCKKESCTLGDAETYPAGTAIADYDIPTRDGGDYLILEGSKQVEFTLLEATDEAGNPHPNLHVMFDYLTTKDEPGAFRQGGELKLNEPFVVPIQPTEADMPHQTKSLWVLRIYSAEPNAFGFNISVDVVRGYDVVDWPPHPDLYADRTERILFDQSVTLESKGTVDFNLYGRDGGWVRPERIISYGTDRIEITISDVKFEGQDGAPAVGSRGFVLEYHNASKPPLMGNGAQYGDRLEDPATDGATWHYTLDISNDPQSYDTPYGQSSRWGFRFVPKYEDEDGTICPKGDDGINGFLQQVLVGCQFVPYKITYTAKIVAYGHSTATTDLDQVQR